MIWHFVGGQWPPLRLGMCKQFDTVRRVVAPYDKAYHQI